MKTLKTEAYDHDPKQNIEARAPKLPAVVVFGHTVLDIVMPAPSTRADIGIGIRIRDGVPPARAPSEHYLLKLGTVLDVHDRVVDHASSTRKEAQNLPALHDCLSQLSSHQTSSACCFMPTVVLPSSRASFGPALLLQTTKFSTST